VYTKTLAPALARSWFDPNYLSDPVRLQAEALAKIESLDYSTRLDSKVIAAGAARSFKIHSRHRKQGRAKTKFQYVVSCNPSATGRYNKLLEKLQTPLVCFGWLFHASWNYSFPLFSIIFFFMWIKLNF
jgi:hypothetical protein